MPGGFSGKIPLPSLQAYTAISVLLLSLSFYYATQKTLEPELSIKIEENSQENVDLIQPMGSIRLFLKQLLIKHAIMRRIYDVSVFHLQDPFCIWVLINTAYCMMIIIGKCVQKLIFGELRAIEQQHMKDKFWNFCFYKFIFIFGVLNAQYMEEVVVWCAWFLFVGSFHLLSQLCKDRFDYLASSPTTPTWTHFKLFGLLFFILMTSIGVCIAVGLHTNLSTFCFMSAEWTLVTLRTLYVLIRYVLHLYDISQEGIWEKRGVYNYYTELIYILGSHVVEFLHHLQMLFWGNIFLSMATLVICMQLRYLFIEIQRKLIRHKNYLRVSRHVESHYPLASKEEIDSNDEFCAICWDQMESARKLPCGHMFHTPCLHSWLEQVTTCPTCRTPLANDTNGNTRNRTDVLGQNDMQAHTANQTTNHFFHFDGSRYVSWFPSFSVEVSHTSLLAERPQLAAQPSHLDAMVHQVLQMFPDMPYNLVFDDLLLTRSIDNTVENILEQRLVSPPTVNFPNNTTNAVSSISSSSSLDLFLCTSTRSRSSSSESSSSGSSNIASNLSTHQQCPVYLRGASSVIQSTNPEPSTSQQSSQISNENTLRTGAEGFRFSKSSYEREQMLTQRKKELLRKAKNNYMKRAWGVNLDEK